MTTAPLLFLYGTLRRAGESYEKLHLDTRLRFIMPCVVRGKLFDLGPYPAFLNGEGLVHGELFEPADATILSDLDAFEEFDPRDTTASLYLREPVSLVGSPLEAYVYRYNRPVYGAAEIASGDWIAHRRSMEAKSPPDPQIKLEQAASLATRERRWAVAIPIWEELVSLNPRWEFGYPFYFLGACYEAVGASVSAETAFRRAAAIDPNNTMFTEALADFLEIQRKRNDQGRDSNGV
ncbi:MAG: gamma-glutamylcyclotransferase [Bauldia sp.]|nr:gamma-glutamylcyclotransferase [Bauldia sp.]